MHEVPSSNSELVVQGDFEAFSPQELFDYWVTPSLITQWWCEVAVIRPCHDGDFTLSWPKIGWELKGRYTEFDPPSKLAFTWKWNHDIEDRAALSVALSFDPVLSGGTLLTITHGPYSDDPEDQAARKGHLEGWIHFCMKLASLRPGGQDSENLLEAEA